MPVSLANLESQRFAIAQQITRLGDLRPGSITSTSGRCGKPNCRCHQSSQAVHGPHERLTYKVNGKTVSESLPSPAAVRKAEHVVHPVRTFQRLSRAFVELIPRMCA